MKLRNKLLVLSLCFTPLLMTSCNKPEPIPSEFESITRSIYEKARIAGYEGTYEEWLESIKGPKGDAGKSITKIIDTGIKDGKATYNIVFSDGSITNLEIPLPKDGVSVIMIEKTSSQGLIDIYTITFSDGKTSMFTVTNGAKGDQGVQGIPGKDGVTPTVEISEDGFWVINDEKTAIKAQGPKGKDGVSITKVEKTSTEGLVDTYTITFSDGKTSQFTVTNGKDGVQGEQGIQGIPGKDGVTPTIEISSDGYWVINGETTVIKAQGPKGKDGVSITKVEKTSSDGLVDTYTITYSDGKTSSFTVTNGNDGVQGEQGIQGIPGKDGVTPTVGISDDGFWVINGEKQAIRAGGEKGEQGEAGRSAYEIYLDTYPDEKSKYPTEKSWIDALINGELDKKNSFVVTFVVDGQVTLTQNVKKGDNASRPEPPVKEGHKFVGWYLNDVEWVFEGYVVTKNITLTAKFVVLEGYKDFNEDGVINNADIIYYENYIAWKKDANKATDFNGDSLVDINDYKAFLGFDSWLNSEIATDYNNDKVVNIEDYYIHVEYNEWLNGFYAYDLNDDRKIDYTDFILSKQPEYRNYLKWVRSSEAADFNNDGIINMKDYDILKVQGEYKVYNYTCEGDLNVYIVGTKVLIRNLGVYLANTSLLITQNGIQATLDTSLINALGDKAQVVQDAIKNAKVEISSRNTFNITLQTSLEGQPFALNLSFVKDEVFGGFKTSFKYTEHNKRIEVAFNIQK